MKLLRASCDCGFITQKARSGYHHHQWWFPLFSPATGTLTDILRALPPDDRKNIDRLSADVFTTIPSTDKPARRDASARIKRLSDELHKTFIAREMQTLRDKYAVQDDNIFNPMPESVFRCPQCNKKSLRLHQVRVIAFCKTDCGHEYQWPDSEERGCPKCGYRPHAFRTESEERFAGQPRTICSCPCSSATDCTSHVDGYCPKCGSLADAYYVDDKHVCGTHHEVMLPYNAPGDFLFMEAESRWVADQFPNAKLWGDAPDVTDSVSGSYCVSCESDHQRWLQLNVTIDD